MKQIEMFPIECEHEWASADVAIPQLDPEESHLRFNHEPSLMLAAAITHDYARIL